MNSFRNDSINKSIQMKPLISNKLSPSINLDNYNRRSETSCYK